MKGRPNYLAWTGAGLFLTLTVVFSLTTLHFSNKQEQVQRSLVTANEFLLNHLESREIESQRLLQDSIASSTEIHADLKNAISLFSCFGILSSILVYLVIQKQITHPLRQATDAANILADGHVGFKLKLESSTEIGQLADAIRNTNLSIHKLEGELKKFAKALQKGQLNYRIDQNLLPGFYQNILKKLNQGMESLEARTNPNTETDQHANNLNSNTSLLKTKEENSTIVNLMNTLQSQQQANDEQAFDESTIQSIIQTLHDVIGATRAGVQSVDADNELNLPANHSELAN